MTFFDSPQASAIATGIAGFVALVGAACAGVYRNFSLASLKITAVQIQDAVAGEKQRADRLEVQVFQLKEEIGIVRGELAICRRELEFERQRNRPATTTP